jgi:translation initiation factor IF-3
VCKILDYGKFKYLQKKKQAEARRNQTHQDLKEVKLRPKTDDHDYEFKLKHCRRFLEAGDKVKVTVMFRGREVIHKDIAIKRLKGIATEVEDLAKVEVAPKMEGRTMHMILAPKAGKEPRKSSKQKKREEAERAESSAPENPAETAG